MKKIILSLILFVSSVSVMEATKLPADFWKKILKEYIFDNEKVESAESLNELKLLASNLINFALTCKENKSIVDQLLNERLPETSNLKLKDLYIKRRMMIREMIRELKKLEVRE